MSYRSFKHVLGETSLERKCRYLFGGCLLLLIAGSFGWYGKQTEYLVYKQNPDQGRLHVRLALMETHWEHLDRDEHNPEFRDVIKQLSSELQGQPVPYRYIGNTKAPLVVQPESQFERELIERFKSSHPEAEKDEFDYQFTTTDDGEPLYVYYQPIRVQETCTIVCHKPEPAAATMAALQAGPSGTSGNMGVFYPRPPQDGDLMAIARVDMPNGPTAREVVVNRAILISTALITAFLAMVASYVIVRYVIVKPLKHLRDVSDAVSHGNIDQRADIHTSDEFEELAVAFNRMLRHLVAAQEELRHVNGDLDAKVDQLAQVNMRLFEMNRLKSDFLATMSHELRTPLNSIIGFSDVLGSIASLDDKQRRYVQNIQKSGKMLLDMINDILDLAKIESGKMEVRLADFRIEQVVAGPCDMARPLTERKNIDLDVEIAPRLPELHQDQAKVQQILNNLLSNAIKFTPEGGRIVVAARREPRSGDLLLVVTDTGVGIAEEDQTAIFEKFRQGNTVLPDGDAMTREFSGTGLGLSIVKELCKLLGGEVTLVSELGKGSEFTVRLPWVFSVAPRSDVTLSDTDSVIAPRNEDAEATYAATGEATRS